MYAIIKFFLFLLPAETAHTLTTKTFSLLAHIPFVRYAFNKLYRLEEESLSVRLWGLDFPNPVGLAAGFDKNGSYIRAMALLGFGFIEVGTVTPKPQAGNPKPRLFRLPKDHGLINRMGFNNKGVDNLVINLKKQNWGRLIIGGNIGKNKTTPNDEAWRDYLTCFQKLYNYVDYFVVNLSSPNTPGLRELQDKEPLRKILSVLIHERAKRNLRKPLLLKIAPEINAQQIDDMIEILNELDVDGIIATNTTVSRAGLHTSSSKIASIGNGGLSGVPLQIKSTDVIRLIRSKTDIPVIGVGGIDSAGSAIEKMEAGARLIQLYSGLIYEGPSLVRRINESIFNSSSK